MVWSVLWDLQLANMASLLYQKMIKFGLCSQFENRAQMFTKFDHFLVSDAIIAACCHVTYGRYRIFFLGVAPFAYHLYFH